MADMEGTVWPSPAKLNLFLHITSQRADGYHELQTLFQMLDWGDDLHFKLLDEDSISRARPIPGVSEQEDLCIRAARLLKYESGCKGGVQIGLNKQIPFGAGLGGGSSNAATVLRALNVLWDCGLSLPELSELGVRLGADVPVFIQGHTAWAEGVGDILVPYRVENIWYVLVFPGINISTADIFNDPGLKRDSAPVRAPGFDWERGRNDCQDTVLRRFPAMKNIMQDLSQWGSPRLTGTGSCIFLPFREKKQALMITKVLESRYNVRAVRGVDHSALLTKLSGGC